MNYNQTARLTEMIALVDSVTLIVTNNIFWVRTTYEQVLEIIPKRAIKEAAPVLSTKEFTKTIWLINGATVHFLPMHMLATRLDALAVDEVIALYDVPKDQEDLIRANLRGQYAKDSTWLASRLG
jgi:hypothetical protein